MNDFITMTTEQKLDKLIQSISALQKTHDESHKQLEGKLQKLEADVVASKALQEDVTERALKCLRRDKPYEFRRKGHEEQYRFNSEVSDHVASVASQLSKLQLSLDKDKAIIKKAKKELEEGGTALAERQKHICIANQSDHSWETGPAYLGNNIASDEEDAKRIDKAKKTAEQRDTKRKRKAAAATAPQQARSQVGTPAPQTPGQPAHYLLPRPALYPPPAVPTRPVGPCFHCGEVGHLKLSCPRRNKSYPFDMYSSLRAAGSNVLYHTGPQGGGTSEE